MKTSRVFKWIAIIGAIMLTCGVLFVSFAVFVVLPAQKKLIQVVSKPLEEKEEAVRAYYATHSRLPTNLVELADFAREKDLAFDSTPYKRMSFSLSNDTVHVSYVGRFGPGWSTFPLEEFDPMADFLGDHPEYAQFMNERKELEQVISAFVAERAALPADLSEIKEFLSSSTLDVDLSSYLTVTVNKKLFGGVEVKYETIPVANHHRSGTFRISKESLETKK